jgi:hypothetical protein
VLFALLLCACTQRVYSVGTSNPDRPGLKAGVAFHLERDPASEVSEFDASLERKLTKLLRERGFRVGDAQQADYFLYYDFKSHPMMANMKLELLQGATSGMETVRRGGPYVQSLRLLAVEASRRAPSGHASIVWEGGAVMTGQTQSRRFQNLLIVEAIARLGHTTEDTVVARMRLNDGRAKRLRD